MSYYDYFELFNYALYAISYITGLNKKYTINVLSNDSYTILENLDNVISSSKITIPSFENYDLPEFVYSIIKEESRRKSMIYLCSLLFSSLDYSSIYKILLNILLEHSVVFVSNNLTLLSGVILAYCYLLAPMKWEHIIIPIVSDGCLEMLEAPVPFLMGVPRSAAEGEEFINDTWCQETIIILLDINKVIESAPLDKELIPNLDGMEKKLKNALGKFNSKGLCYNPSEDQKNEIIKMCEIVENSINNAIIKKIPSNAQKIGGPTIILNEICNKLISNAEKPDKKFLEMFKETQMLASYLERNDLI